MTSWRATPRPRRASGCATRLRRPTPRARRSASTYPTIAPSPPPAPPAPPTPLPPEAPALPTKIPERPLLRVVVDANIILDAGDLSPAYLLQDCGAVRIILPLRVAKELDGLKNSSDEDIARRARRANAFFSDPRIRRQPWLELEQGAGVAANRTADEEILDVALAAQKEGATVLCTRDKNLRLRAAHAGVDALDLVETRSKAHARDVSWRRAYGHLLPAHGGIAARRAICDAAAARLRPPLPRRDDDAARLPPNAAIVFVSYSSRRDAPAPRLRPRLAEAPALDFRRRRVDLGVAARDRRRERPGQFAVPATRAIVAPP